MNFAGSGTRPVFLRSGLRTLILLCFALLAGSGRGARAEQVALRSFTETDGLTNLTLLCLQQDSSGYILACTEHGLYAFDGRRFLNLGPQQGLPDGGIVTGLAFGPDRRLIVRYQERVFVSNAPLSLLDPPERLRFRAAVSEAGLISDIDSSELVRWRQGALFVRAGRLYYVDAGSPTRQPVVRSEDGFLKRPNGPIRAHSPLAVGRDGAVWVALLDGRLCMLSQERARCYGRMDGVPAEAWIAFHMSSSGRLFARSTFRLAEIDPGSGSVRSAALPNQGRRSSIYLHPPVLAEAPSGQIITQAVGGLMIQSGSGWKMLSSAAGLPPVPISFVLFDHENDLWLAADGAGAMELLGYGVWENLNHRDGLSNDMIWQIVRQPGGPLWVATDAGFDAVGSQGAAPIRAHHYGGASYAVAADAAGHVWRSLAAGGVSRIDVASGTARYFPLPPVGQILNGAGGRLWFMTEKGIYLLDDPASHHAVPRQLAGLPDQIGDAVVASDGSLWILYHRELLHRHADGSVISVVVPWQQPDLDPRSIALGRNGAIWVGGIGGLYRLDLAGDRLVRTTRIEPPDIVSNTILSLLVDSRGWTWVGTDSGLSVFDGARWIAADTGDGLISNDLNQDSLLEDVDGSIWIGTSRGLSHLLDPRRLFARPRLRPVITSVLLGGKPFPDETAPFSRAPLVLRFGVLNFQSSDGVRFRYRLDGVDEGWADTAGSAVRYASLPPGRHQFTVIAYDPLTGQSCDPVTVTLRMKEPWWFCWPVLIAYGLAGIGLAYGVLRLRYRLLLRQKRALQREVELRTREIREAQAALQLQATQDSLTKLLTRGEIQARLVDLLAQSRRPQLTVGLLDIDHFKRINDGHGHLAGDDILKEIGRRLNAALQPGEHAGRYGGEEILLVLDIEVTAGIDRIHALKAAACDARFPIAGGGHDVTCSIGVTQARVRDDWESLIGRADHALYRAKAQGRNRVVIAPADVSKFG